MTFRRLARDQDHGQQPRQIEPYGCGARLTAVTVGDSAWGFVSEASLPISPLGSGR